MNTYHKGQAGYPKGELYHIRIGQHLDPQCSDWFPGLVITNLAEGQAILSGYLIDQAALHGVLQHLQDLNVPLIELRRESLSQDQTTTNK